MVWLPGWGGPGAQGRGAMAVYMLSEIRTMFKANNKAEIRSEAIAILTKHAHNFWRNIDYYVINADFSQIFWTKIIKHEEYNAFSIT